MVSRASPCCGQSGARGALGEPVESTGGLGRPWDSKQGGTHLCEHGHGGDAHAAQAGDRREDRRPQEEGSHACQQKEGLGGVGRVAVRRGQSRGYLGRTGASGERPRNAA